MPFDNKSRSLNPTVIIYTSDKNNNNSENKKQYHSLDNIVIHNPSQAYSKNHIAITISLVPLVPLESIVISA